MDKSDSRNCGSRNIGICGTAEIEDQWDATSSLQCHPQAYQIKKKKKSENNSDYKDYQNSKLAFQKNFLTYFFSFLVKFPPVLFLIMCPLLGPA